VRWLALLVGLLATGCGGPGYLMRAGWQEARILLRRQPITALLARPDLDPGLRARLALTLAVRDFAAGPLGLNVGRSYTTFAEVSRDETVYVVAAARRDRLEAYTWRYPLVGRLPYRGFFDRGAAEAAAAELAAADLDVEVRPAVAFSTLGWFADPLLSTAAAGPPVGVAETVIHELFHATLYVPGAAAFNESAATFAGHRGAEAFFCAGPGADAPACATARRRWDATRARGQVLGRLAARLRRLYAVHPAPAVLQRQRARLAAAAAKTLARRGIAGADDLVPPNNARLLGDLVYATELDTFDRLAPGDADVGPALGALVREARGAADPFAALRVLASRAEGR
jgi:predicted aminopeptidase